MNNVLRLRYLSVVQFFLFDAEEFEIIDNTAFLGPNGTGKTALLDAVQIALLGAHGNYVKLNAQTEEGEKKKKRSIADYCLGTTDSKIKRDDALTYITLAFERPDGTDPVSCGLCLSAMKGKKDAEVEGYYIAPGVQLRLGHHIESLGDDGEAPVDFADFKHTVANLCRAAKTEPIFHKQPERYIQDLLLNTNGGQRINVQQFLKAFQKGFLLRNIDTVDSFVRTFLVESRGVDKHKAREQIETFRELTRQVERTEAQIGALSTLESDFKRLKDDMRRVVGYRTVASNIHYETASERLGDARDAVREHREALSEAIAAVEVLTPRLAQARLSDDAAQRAVNESEPARQMAGINAILTGLQQQAVQQANAPLNAINSLERIAAKLSQPDGAGFADRVSRMLAHASTAKSMIYGKVAGSAEQALADGAKVAGGLVDAVRDKARKADEALTLAKQAESAAEARQDSARKHGYVPENNTATAMREFEKLGFEATPVCTQVSVSDAFWQAAVETYLGPHREALIVTPGNEDRAVRFLLSLPRHARLNGVYIVQPSHQRGASTGPALDKVASVLRGDSRVALNYLRGILGDMMKADNEVQLRERARSMTADGGLSKSGSTSTVDLLPHGRFKLGKQYNAADVSELARELSVAQKSAKEAKEKVSYWNEILNLLGGFADAESVASQIRVWFGQLETTAAAITQQTELAESAQDAGSTKLTEHAKATRAHLDEVQGQLQTASAKRAGADVALKAAEADVMRLEREVEACRDEMNKLRGIEEFDEGVADGLRQEIGERESPGAATEVAERLAAVAQKRFDGRHTSAMQSFADFLQQFDINLSEERGNWRKAAAFSAEERKRLADTELVNYKQRADEARVAAEESFKRDIAVSIANSIHDMRRFLNELNKILREKCPPFTRDERFRFEHKVVPQFDAVYNYIMDAAAGEDSLFQGDASGASKVLQYMQQSVDTGGAMAENPIDDFRLMFSFDVEVYTSEGASTMLSDRIGPGSGGEHKTPFYVIAGAALAHAYRIDSNNPNGGMALMLLDEAFNKMDEQNTQSAAEFLEKIGLQLIVTAPSAESARMIPFCSAVHEMTRNGTDVFSELELIKPAARALMKSDMPAYHPELVQLAMKTIQ